MNWLESYLDAWSDAFRASHWADRLVARLAILSMHAAVITALVLILAWLS